MILMMKSLEKVVRQFCVVKCQYGRYSSATATCPVEVWNEWDPLEEVIVGSAEMAAIPPLAMEAKPCIHPDHWEFYQKNHGRLWSDVLGEQFWTNLLEEREGFIRTLKEFGVTVHQPDPQNFKQSHLVNGFETTGMYCAMPRDILLVVGNEIIEAPMTWRSRYFEFKSYRKLIQNYWKSGARWTCAPKPTYENLFEEDYVKYVTTESEPTFDAADCIKVGRDLLVQRSQVTNSIGIEWIRRHLKESQDMRVIEVSFHDQRPMHIDSTMLPLKPGVFLGNPDRKCLQEDIIKEAGWEIVYAPPRLADNGVPYYLASRWISMNMLSLDPQTMISEAGDTQLHKFLESLNIKVIPLKFRHCNAIGGGFHCWTVDIRRRGPRKDYFKWPKSFLEFNK